MVEKVEVAQALYDFETDQPGELRLKQGQFVQVLSTVSSSFLSTWSFSHCMESGFISFISY